MSDTVMVILAADERCRTDIHMHNYIYMQRHILAAVRSPDCAIYVATALTAYFSSSKNMPAAMNRIDSMLIASFAAASFTAPCRWRLMMFLIRNTRSTRRILNDAIND